MAGDYHNIPNSYNNYTREALEIAKQELKLRNIDFDDKSADFPPPDEELSTFWGWFFFGLSYEHWFFSIIKLKRREQSYR